MIAGKPTEREALSTPARRAASVSPQTVLAFVGAVGVVLAFIGFWRRNPPGDGAELLGHIWRSLALLVVQGGPPDVGHDGWLLAVARLLAPIAAVGAAYALSVNYLARRRQLRRFVRMTNHTIIIGLGCQGRAFAASCDSPVAGLDLSDAIVSADLSVRCVAHAGDGRDVNVLGQVGVPRAARVLIVTGRDADNLEILGRVLECRREVSDPLEIWVRLDNHLLARHLERDDGFARAQGTAGLSIEIHPFDVNRLAAEQLFRVHPLADLADLRGQRRVHAVVIGWSGFTLAFVEHLARLAPYRDFDVPRVDLLVRRPADVRAELAAIQPVLLRHGDDRLRVVDLELHDLEDRSAIPTLDQIHTIEPGPSPSVTAILVAPGSDDAAAAATLTLRERCAALGRWEAPILVEIKGDSMLGTHFDARRPLPDPADRIIRVGKIADVCRIDLLLERERAARTFHEAYLRSRGIITAKPQLVSPNEQPWDGLPQTYRLANLRAADHLPIKLMSAGYCVSGFPLRAPAGARLTTDETDALAVLEHRSWEIDRLLDGWMPGSRRDDRRRVNEAIGVPFDLLDETLRRPMRKFDYDQIAAAWDLLTSTNGKITVRREFRLGLIGHRDVSTANRRAILDGLLRVLPPLLDSRQDDYISLYTPLAPGADLLLTQAVSDWLGARGHAARRVVVIRAVPYEVVLEAYLRTSERGRIWSATDTPTADAGDTASQIRSTIDTLLVGMPESVVANILPVGRSMEDWALEPALCHVGYRHANACIALRCDAIVAFHDPSRQRPGDAPAPGGTTEALNWANDPSVIPEEHAVPWRRSVTRPTVSVVPFAKAAPGRS